VITESRSARETEVGEYDFELGDGEIMGFLRRVDVDEAKEADRELDRSNEARSANVGDGGRAAVAAVAVMVRLDRSNAGSDSIMAVSDGGASWSNALQSNNSSRSGASATEVVANNDEGGGGSSSCASTTSK